MVRPTLSKARNWAYALIAVAWKSGCIEAEYPFGESTTFAFSRVGEDLKELLGDLEDSPQAWLETLARPSHAAHPPEDIEDSDTASLRLSEEQKKFLRPGVFLIGRAQSAIFNVFRPSESERSKHGFASPLKIHGKHDQVVGGLGNFPLTLNHDNHTTAAGDEVAVELISLSPAGSLDAPTLEHFVDPSVLKEVGGEQLLLIAPFEAEHLSFSLWPIQNTRHVRQRRQLHALHTLGQRNGHHMAGTVRPSTRGVGWMLLASWIEAEREFKTIFLQ